MDTRYRTEPIATPVNWKTLEYHPSADVERMMTLEEAKELRASILDHYDKSRPIVVIECEDGQLRILDGRNRNRECAALDDEGLLAAPPPFDRFVGSALPVEYKTYACTLNESHKRLTKRENRDRALRIKERWAVEHAEKNAKLLRENAVRGGDARAALPRQSDGTFAPAVSRQIRDTAGVLTPIEEEHRDSCGPSIAKASEATGIGKEEISELARLKRFGPDLFELVMSEKMPRKEALAQLRERAIEEFEKTGRGLPPADGSVPKNSKDYYLPGALKKKSSASKTTDNSDSTSEGGQLTLVSSATAPTSESLVDRQRREMAKARASAKKTNAILDQALRESKEGTERQRAEFPREMILSTAGQGLLQSYSPDDLVIVIHSVFVGLPQPQRMALMNLLMKEV